MNDGHVTTVDTFDDASEARAIAAHSFDIMSEKNPDGVRLGDWIERNIHVRDVAHEIDGHGARSLFKSHFKGDPIARGARHRLV